MSSDLYILVKLGGVGILAIIAFILAIRNKRPILWLVFLGMVFSWLGDAVLTDLPIMEKYFRPALFYGIGFFAIVQLIYIAIFMLFASEHENGLKITGAAQYLALTTAVTIWFLYIRRHIVGPFVSFSVLLYSLLLFAMLGSSIGLSLASRRINWLLIVGSVLFVLSDVLIALAWFVEVEPTLIGVLVWLHITQVRRLLRRACGGLRWSNRLTLACRHSGDVERMLPFQRHCC